MSDVLFKRPGTKTFWIKAGPPVSCVGDSRCFNDLVHKLNEYQVEDLRLISSLNEDHFHPNFSAIEHPNKLKRLSLSTSGMPHDQFAPEFELSVFKKFNSVTSLELIGMSFRGSLQEYFPKLNRLFLTYPDNTVANLDTCWGQLEWIRFDKFRGDITTVGKLPNLTDLRLYSASISSLDGIADTFPKLETLIIEGQRKALDILPLEKCQNLKNLKFDAFTKTIGIDDLKIPQLETAFLSALEIPNFVVNHSNMSWFRTKRYLGLEEPSLEDHEWAKFGSGYGFGGEVIPTPLRK